MHTYKGFLMAFIILIPPQGGYWAPSPLLPVHLVFSEQQFTQEPPHELSSTISAASAPEGARSRPRVADNAASEGHLEKGRRTCSLRCVLHWKH